MAATATQEHEQTIAAWQGFRIGLWQTDINDRDFIQQNYESYDGDESFLAPARTQTIWKKLQELSAEERRKGVLDICQFGDVQPPSSALVERTSAAFRAAGLNAF
jgi:pyruvate-formate lyase